MLEEIQKCVMLAKQHMAMFALVPQVELLPVLAIVAMLLRLLANNVTTETCQAAWDV